MTCYADRCHVLYHKPTEKYVMWCKSKPFISVSVSTSPVGPFTLVPAGPVLPDGHEVGDCTVFEDKTAAYFVLSIHPSSYGFSRNESRRELPAHRPTSSGAGNLCR